MLQLICAGNDQMLFVMNGFIDIWDLFHRHILKHGFLRRNALAAPLIRIAYNPALPVDLRNIGALPIIKISDKGQYPVNGLLQAAG